jgi:hypothetical protein
MHWGPLLVGVAIGILLGYWLTELIDRLFGDGCE